MKAAGEGRSVRGPVGRALVVCIGNDLVADDAAGCLLHARLEREALPPSVRLLLVGVGGIRLIDDLSGEDLLVVCDAVHFGSPVGTVHRIDWDDVPSLSGPAVSAHGIGLREVLEITRVLYPERLPKRAVLVGIEGVCFDQFEPPSPPVVAAVDRAARLVMNAVGLHRSEAQEIAVAS